MRFPLLLLLPLLLTACASQPVSAPNLNAYNTGAPIALAVGKVTVIEEYRSPLTAPNVEHLFKPTPAQAVRRWAYDRVLTTGGSAILEVIVKDARVVSASLPRTDGLKGVFTRDQSERFDGHIAVELRIYDGGAMSQASVTAEVNQSRTLAENASVASREALFAVLQNDLMTALDRELEKNIRQYFGNYLR